MYFYSSGWSMSSGLCLFMDNSVFDRSISLEVDWWLHLVELKLLEILNEVYLTPLTVGRLPGSILNGRNAKQRWVSYPTVLILEGITVSVTLNMHR